MENLRDTLAWYDDADDTKATLKLSKSAWKVQVIVHRQEANENEEDD